VLIMMLALQAEQRHQGVEIGIHASIHLLRGQAFEALDNRQRAIESFKAALRYIFVAAVGSPSSLIMK
jgi:hypothetical protein